MTARHTDVGTPPAFSLCSPRIPLTPQTGGRVKKRIYAGVGASALIAIVALAATVSGAFARSGATPLPAASCSGIVNGSGKLLIASDLPLEGSGRTQTSQMTRAIKFIFKQHGWKAGKYTLAYQSCDDATAQAGKWDSGKCSADALLAQQLGIKKIYILNDKEAYGLGVATNFKNAAKKLGLTIAGFTAWDGKASSYEAQAVKIKQAGSQGVFLGGLICENGGKLIKDLRNGLGSKVKILMPDGFTPISATVQQGGAATEGATVSVAGLPNSALKGAGKAFVAAFTKADHRPPDPYSVYAAQAAEVFVQAIKQSNGTRADIAKQLFKVNLKGSILGDVSFNANGDVTSNPVTIYKIKGGKSTTLKVIVPPKSLV